MGLSFSLSALWWVWAHLALDEMPTPRKRATSNPGKSFTISPAECSKGGFPLRMLEFRVRTGFFQRAGHIPVRNKSEHIYLALLHLHLSGHIRYGIEVASEFIFLGLPVLYPKGNPGITIYSILPISPGDGYGNGQAVKMGLSGRAFAVLLSPIMWRIGL